MQIKDIKRGLGRGLEALLEDSNTYLKDYIRDIEIDHIESNKFQPRKVFNENALEELADSIKIHGIIQPITVKKISNQNYQLIAGERRLLAAKKLGLKLITAYIKNVNKQTVMEMSLIENIQRQDLNAMEIALAYQILLEEFKLNQETLAKRVGKDRTTITNYLRLLKLPTEIQAGLKKESITMGHAKALMGLSNTEMQLNLFQKTLKEILSVRALENLVSQLKNRNMGVEKKHRQIQKEIFITEAEQKLEKLFKTTVSIQKNKRDVGSIKINFKSLNQLKNLFSKLNLFNLS